MKRIFLILLCLPMIGFGQSDCGEKPKNPNPFSKNKNSSEQKKYKKDLKAWEDCVALIAKTGGPIKADSRLGNKWIYDNNLFYEVIYEEDLEIEEGHIDISITKGLMSSSYLKGATIKVQKKNGRTRVLVYDFEMGTDDWGSLTGFGNVAFGSSTEQTYNFIDNVFNRKTYTFKKWITMSWFDKVETGILEGIANKAGASKDILNEDW